MARQPRLDLPGSLQLVSARGIGRCLIFRDDKDRMSFVAKLRSLVEETQTRCYAWSLLPNTFHLLLGIDTMPLSTMMRRLITAYASNFNRKYRRVGPLFYSRYKSTLCEKEPYFLELVRHVHLKPLQTGVVKNLSELDEYPWTGHYVLMSDSSPQKTQKMDAAKTAKLFQQSPIDKLTSNEVLLHFSPEKDEARQLYRDFLKKGIQKVSAFLADKPCSLRSSSSTSLVDTLQPSRLAASRVSTFASSADNPWDGRILGSGAFVARTLKEAGELTEPKVNRVSLQDLCNKIRCHFDVDEEDMRSPIKKKLAANAKAVFCYLAIRKMGYYGVEVGDYLNMRGFSANRAAERGKIIFQTSGLDPSAFL